MKESIGCLPEEIQGYILSKVDGHSAAICKRVCRLWNEIIEGFEISLHFWLRCCLKEIPSHMLVELTRLMQLGGGRESTLIELATDWTTSLEGKLPWMFWREVYAEFHRCSYIKFGCEKKTELHFFPLHGEVSSLHVQNNVIYTGHESGAVMAWSNIYTDLSCETLYKHKRRVTCVAGLDMVMSTKDILNGECSSMIVSSSKDRTLRLYNTETEMSETIINYSKQVNGVRTWGSFFVAAADKCFIQGQPIWKANQLDVTADTMCTLFSQSASDITAVAFWEDTVLSGDEMGNIFQWNGCVHCEQEGSQDMLHVANLHSRVKTILIQGPRIICYTSDNMLHISRYRSDTKLEFDSLDIYNAITKTAQCVAIRGPVLAIGCKSGFVYLYYVPSDSDWKLLDLSLPTRVIQLHKEHIHAIIIDDDGGGPFIAIATNDYCIHIVRYSRKKVADSELPKCDKQVLKT